MPAEKEKDTREQATQRVIAQRVNAIYELHRDGWRTAAIVQDVARRQTEEINAEREAKKAGKKALPRIWPDKPLPTRTFFFYLKKAKTRLLEDGRALMKPGAGDKIVAKNFARQDALYLTALVEKRYEVCRKIIVDQLTLCGLMGALKVSLSPFDTGEGEAAVGQAERTLPEIVDEQFALFNAARKRVGLPPLPKPRDAKLRLEA